MRILRKNTNGITLIALVITIILLLILAGITITQLTGSGLFGNAKIAKERTRYGTAKEIVELKLMEIETECIKQDDDYTLAKVADGMKEAKDITTQNYYYKKTSKEKDGLNREPRELEGVAVSVDEYKEYIFLIGKRSENERIEIIGAVKGEKSDIGDTSKFEPIDEFEKKILGGTTGGNGSGEAGDTDKEPEDVDTEVPGISEDIDLSNPIEITTYMAVKSNTNNNLKLSGVENASYEMQEKTADIDLTGNIVTANKNADSKDSCQIKITGTYNGQSYINNLTIYVEPKNITTVTDKDENVEKAYAIYVPQDLIRLGELVNHKVVVENYNAKIMNEIDLNSVCKNQTVSWQPIGNYNENETIYTGIFDGNNKQISNIYINEPTKQYQSFFGKIENSFIKNVTIEGNITGYRFIGGIIGYAVNSNILKCTNNVEIIAKFAATGGIIGRGDDNMRIEKCINNKPIQQDGAVAGGIIGAAIKFRGDVEFIITECINKGSVTASGKDEYDESFVGGIVGNSEADIITNCYNTKAIYGEGICVGGIVGCSRVEVNNCYNSGNITSGLNAHGGIVGWTDKDVSNCINCGNVSDEDITSMNLTGDPGKWIGAIIGYTTNIAKAKDCLNIEKSTLVEYTDEQIKSILSNAFKEDTDNENEGLPMLSWE